MIYIHRGKIFKNIKENSYKGFRLCINNGLNIETDIQFIKDDTPVCYHDFDLRRINRIKTKIKNLNIGDLKKYKIIKLSDLINLLKKKTKLLLEIKPFLNKNNILVLYNLIKNKKRNIKVISFKEKNLVNLRNLDTNLRLGLIFDGRKNLHSIKSKLKKKHINFFVLYKNKFNIKKITKLKIQKIYYTFKNFDMKKFKKSENLIIEDLQVS